MKTPTLFREYIWLINTIYEARAITLAEINQRWVRTEMSGGVEMARTTFYRHKLAIEEIFGILIDCDQRNGNRYFIGNNEVLREDNIQNWMLSTLTVVNNLLSDNPNWASRVGYIKQKMHEDKPIGNTFNNAQVTMQNPTIDGPMYNISGNENINFGGTTNGEEQQESDGSDV